MPLEDGDTDLPSSSEPSAGKGARAGFVAGCSNFSIQYNYTSASIATAIMLSHRDATGENVTPDYPEPGWAKDILNSTVFIGSVLGMLIMGYLGDLLGVRRALMATNSLVVLGALGSGLLSWGKPSTVWLVITLSRFILGVGAGGNYPLSAAKASEAAPAAHEAVAKAGRAFFWQCPGSLAPYLLGLALLAMPREPDVTSKQFRALFSVGAIPGLVVLWASAREPDSRAERVGSGGKSRLAGSLLERRHWCMLVGTGGTWFLYDIALYGTVIFAPNILGHVFGAKMSLRDMALRSAFMVMVGTCGMVSGLAALKHISPKKLNVIGLSLGGLIYALFAGVHRFLPEFKRTLFVLLCLLYYTLYTGPNVATFVLPVISFPSNVRSTFHGLSSAAAKAGAMLGALLFPIMDERVGLAGVMATQALVCFSGALLGSFFLSDSEAQPDAQARDLDDDTKSFRLLPVNTPETDSEDERSNASASWQYSRPS